jgi:pyruvate dehydrogenase E2 component (dihydrolipoyllysine-residue acetyltransferase)
VPDVLMPRLSDTMTEGVLSAWLKHEGDAVQRGDVLAEIETDKAVMELESYETGVLTRLLVAEGTVVPIGAPIAVIGDEGAPPEPPPPPTRAEPEAAAARAAAAAAAGTVAPPAPAPAQPVGRGAADVRATPLVRRLAREHDIDLAAVTGTGPNGRIVRADVEELLAGGAPARPEPAAVPGVAGDEEVPLTAMRRITAERLTQSAAAPHFYLTMAVDAGPLLELRADLNRQVFTGDDRCSVTDLLVRAVAVTLAGHRQVNASWAGDRVLRHGRVNVGIAVALENGLIVPVVRDADRKGLAEIVTEAHALTRKARAGRLTPDEFSEGTFTISNLGTFGVEHFTAVINPPEAAILAVGGTVEEPVVREGQVVVRPMMRMTLTSDHRVLDGAVSAAFLRDLVDLLGQPLRLLA